MSEWWLSRGDGKIEGPLSTQALVLGLVAGEIPNHAHVCGVGEQEWVLVSQIEAIWDAVDPEESNTSVTERPWFLGGSDSGRHKLPNVDVEDERTQLLAPMPQIAAHREFHPSRISSQEVDARAESSAKKVAEPAAGHRPSAAATDMRSDPARARVTILEGIADQPATATGACAPNQPVAIRKRATPPPKPGTSRPPPKPGTSRPPPKPSASRPPSTATTVQQSVAPVAEVRGGKSPHSPASGQSPVGQAAHPPGGLAPATINATLSAAAGLAPLGVSPQRTAPGVVAPGIGGGAFAGLSALSPLQSPARAASEPSAQLLQHQRVEPSGIPALGRAPSAQQASAPPVRPAAPSTATTRAIVTQRSASPSTPPKPYGSSHPEASPSAVPFQTTTAAAAPDDHAPPAPASAQQMGTQKPPRRQPYGRAGAAPIAQQQPVVTATERTKARFAPTATAPGATPPNTGLEAESTTSSRLSAHQRPALPPEDLNPEEREVFAALRSKARTRSLQRTPATPAAATPPTETAMQRSCLETDDVTTVAIRSTPATPPPDSGWDDDAPTETASSAPAAAAPSPLIVSAPAEVIDTSRQHPTVNSSPIERARSDQHPVTSEIPASLPPDSSDEATTILRTKVAPKPPEQIANPYGVATTAPQRPLPAVLTGTSSASPKRNAIADNSAYDALVSDPSQLLEEIDDEAASIVHPPVVPIVTRPNPSPRRAVAVAPSPVLASPPSTPPPARRARLSIPTIVLKPEPAVHQEATQPAVRALRRRSPIRITYGSLIALVLAIALIALAVLFFVQRR